ncbi:putative ABC transport system permease protein [Brevibacillus sp. AG162]|nr:putative ABC transport system permease protein [Brevibacillus sp. AG162]
MAMLQMILRKMMNNRWLVGSLLIGLIVAVGLVSSIPAFTSGVLQRMLTKDLEEYQKNVKRFPGGLLISVNQNKLGKNGTGLVDEMAAHLQSKVIASLGVPVYEEVTILRTIPFDARQPNIQPKNPISSESTRLYSLSALEQHMTLIDGRLPAATPVDGVYEALVTEKALKDRRMVLGSLYELTASEAKGLKVRIKPVGVFKEKEGNDPYWFVTTSEYSNGFILDERLFRKTFLEEKNLVISTQMYAAFHYQSFRISDTEKLNSVVAGIEGKLQQLGLKKAEINVQFPAASLVGKYNEQEKQFKTILWSLYIPIFIMLGLYLVMVSGLIVERQRTEIAVLGSRGASRMQIFSIYFMEIAILGLCAFLIGPVVGIQLSKILGISNGFLEFVDRKGLDVTISSEVFVYAAWMVLACITLVLISVFLATRQNIVTHKQSMARMGGRAIWHRLFLDVLLLAISWYGWYSYQNAAETAAKTSEGASAISIDFLLFFVPVLFSLGFGLLLLRLYPWVLRLMSWAGRSFFPLSLHTTLVQVGRAPRQYHFLMLFVTSTVAVGMFSASMARTINQNAEERIRYQMGADIRLKAEWKSDKPEVTVFRRGNNVAEEGEEGGVEKEPVAPPVQYVEPDFALYSGLPGVEHATKVYVNGLAEASFRGDPVKDITLMGIDPNEFAKTAWMKPDLLPHHFHEYLNLIAKEPRALLLSRSLADKLQVVEGQTILLGWGDSRRVEMIVYAIVDYWPGWNPATVKSTYGSRMEEQYLAVANLPFVQDKIRQEPYEVWIKMKEGASSESLYKGLEQEGVKLAMLNNAKQQVIQVKNSAFYLGLNGSLTLGFLLSMLVTFIGYVLYWVLTLGARKLQYGVFRAMGMPFRQLLAILAWEQLLTFGVAFAIGMTAGKLANSLFLPALSLYLHADKQVPPFTVISRPQDEQIIYTFIAVTLVIGIGIVGILLSRMQIHQAVKLGED